jgi:hypothetical protein
MEERQVWLDMDLLQACDKVRGRYPCETGVGYIDKAVNK